MGLQMERIREDIIGLVPVYSERGNATVIYLRSGQIEVSQGIRSVVMALARAYALDLKEQRRQLVSKLNRGGFLPFYLNPQRVFVPLKMRRSLAAKDMVYGFFDISYLGDAEAGEEGKCCLVLKDRRRLEVLSRPGTVDKVLNVGRRLKGQLQVGLEQEAGPRAAMEAASTFFASMQAIVTSLKRIEAMMAGWSRGDMEE